MNKNIITLFIFSISALIILPAVSNAYTLEELLKKAEIKYDRGNDGTYAIYVNQDGETTLIGASEKVFGDGSTDDLKLVYLYCIVLPAPSDGKNPPAQIKKVAELNEKLPVGKVGLSESDGKIYYCSSFWLVTADEKTLVKELYIAHLLRQQLKKMLEAY